MLEIIYDGIANGHSRWLITPYLVVFEWEILLIAHVVQIPLDGFGRDLDFAGQRLAVGKLAG